MMNEHNAGARRFSPAPEWVDTHCHLDGFARAGTLDDVLRAARAANVGKMVLAGTTPEDGALYQTLAAAHPDALAHTVGLHPQEVDEHFEAALASIEALLAAPDAPCAVGEVGLDYYRPPKDSETARKNFERQRVAFAAQIRMANRAHKPLVIHARNAHADTLAILEREGADFSRVVFHCFSEGPEEMRALRERGAWASFTGILTYADAEKTRAACREQGWERLMLETDSPYLSPEPWRKSRPNTPAHVAITGAFAATLFNVPVADLAAATTRNARAFYGL